MLNQAHNVVLVIFQMIKNISWSSRQCTNTFHRFQSLDFSTETNHDQQSCLSLMIIWRRKTWQLMELAWRFLASTTQKYNPKCCQPQLLLRDFEWLNWICSEGFLEISINISPKKGNWIRLNANCHTHQFIGHPPSAVVVYLEAWKRGSRKRVCV